jgi:hypothetical protein
MFSRSVTPPVHPAGKSRAPCPVERKSASSHRRSQTNAGQIVDIAAAAERAAACLNTCALRSCRRMSGGCAIFMGFSCVNDDNDSFSCIRRSASVSCCGCMRVGSHLRYNSRTSACIPLWCDTGGTLELYRRRVTLMLDGNPSATMVCTWEMSFM